MKVSLDSGHADDIRKLNLIWHSVLPGGIVMVVVALYGFVQATAYQPPADVAPLQPMVPAILVTALFVGALSAAFIKRRLPRMAARAVGSLPMQRAISTVFILLGVADAPAIIGIAFFMILPVDWLALAIVFYAFAAGIVFKPDFEALFETAARSGHEEMSSRGWAE